VIHKNPSASSIGPAGIPLETGRGGVYQQGVPQPGPREGGTVAALLRTQTMRNRFFLIMALSGAGGKLNGAKPEPSPGKNVVGKLPKSSAEIAGGGNGEPLSGRTRPERAEIHTESRIKLTTRWDRAIGRLEERSLKERQNCLRR